MRTHSLLAVTKNPAQTSGADEFRHDAKESMSSAPNSGSTGNAEPQLEWRHETAGLFVLSRFSARTNMDSCGYCRGASRAPVPLCWHLPFTPHNPLPTVSTMSSRASQSKVVWSQVTELAAFNCMLPPHTSSGTTYTTLRSESRGDSVRPFAL